MGEPFYGLILGILAVWRVTHLFYAEDGPWDLLVKLRGLAAEGFWGGLLDCFYCLSLWVSAPFAVIIARSWTECFFLFFALSGGAILLHRVSGGDEVKPAPFFEDEEK